MENMESDDTVALKTLTLKGELDPRVESSDDIIFASRIVVKNGSMPTRIVLRKVGEEYVVHDEYLSTSAPTLGYGCRFVHHSFGNGSYFPYNRVGILYLEKQQVFRAYINYKERADRL